MSGPSKKKAPTVRPGLEPGANSGGGRANSLNARMMLLVKRALAAAEAEAGESKAD
jgi:hypothetical protein